MQHAQSHAWLMAGSGLPAYSGPRARCTYGPLQPSLLAVTPLHTHGRLQPGKPPVAGVELGVSEEEMTHAYVRMPGSAVAAPPRPNPNPNPKPDPKPNP